MTRSSFYPAMRNVPSSPRFGSFYGQVGRRRALSFRTLTEVTHSPGFQVPIHPHEDPWFGFVLDGSLIETYCNRTAHVLPLNLMFRTAGESHSDKGGERGARS